PKNGQTRLVLIDVRNGSSRDLAARDGVKISPVALASDEFAYVVKDNDTPGIYYDNGASQGPRGDIRTASWSPDGRRVVYDRVKRSKFPDWQPLYTPHADYQLILTHGLPALDPSGNRLVATGGDTVQMGQNSDLLLMDVRTRQT